VADVPVAIDVTHLHTIDQSGVAFLWQTARVCAERGRTVTLVNPPQHLADEIVALHVADLFTVIHD
jgi:ABC-type transporter Mla MlaB component